MQTWINQHPLLFVFVVLVGIVVFRWLLLSLIATALPQNPVLPQKSAVCPKSPLAVGVQGE
jgi:hypothetical protein